jgi:type I restriction enzyme, S subunit
MSSWNPITIGELVGSGEATIQTGPFGTQFKASEYVESGIPVINVKNIGYGDIRSQGLDFIDDKTAHRLRVHRLKNGDIVFGRKGSADRHVRINPECDGWVQGSDCMRLRLNSKRVNSRFLSFYFCTAGHKYWMEAVCAFGATMTTLNQGIVKRISFRAPPPAVQEKVAAILSSYDELIANNNRRIALLEKLTEEIYREWFVRFRFPGNTTARFGKGLPSDWPIIRIQDCVIRKKFGRIFRENELFADGQVVVIDQSRADCLGYHDGDAQHVASPEAPIILFGDHTCKVELMTKPFSLAENVVPFTSKDNISAYFLFHLIKSKATMTEYKRHWTDLTNTKVLVPSSMLCHKFEEAVIDFHKQTYVLKQENMKLCKLRDLLLPRLISGKFSVDELDIQFPADMVKE